MPTGYTCIIDDNNATFAQYLWRCARGMGALVRMRDNSLGADAPAEFTPDRYYEHSLNRAEKRLAELRAMSDDDARAQHKAERGRVMQSTVEINDNTRETAAKYDAMRAEVEAWEPPTPDHEGLKKFMLEQLDTGFPSYCRNVYTPPPDEGWEVWRAEALGRAIDDVTRSAQRWEEEQERTRQRNEWLAQLRASVPYVSQPEKAQ